jgi:hypothetical protein
MFTKTVSGLLAALAIMTSTAAFAQPARYRSWGGEPKTYGAGHEPRAFYYQEQPGYPQSPPEGGY